MYGKTQRSDAFQERSGSASLRPFLRGYNDIAKDRCALAATCREQLNTLRTNRAALQVTSRELHGEERERVRKIIANMTREIGDIARLLDATTRLEFESIFVQVANKRLPKDAFLEIVEEARAIWRSKGFGEGVGQSHRQTKVRRKYEQKRRLGLLAES